MSAKEEIDIAIDTEDEPAAAENILSPPVVTKYQTAGDLASRALAFVLPRCVPGVTVFELCALGNENIVALAKTVFNKGSVAKGIAFPTCVSVNGLLCHLAPLKSDPEASIALKDGDVVRVELGVHVDGYVARVCSTVVVGASKEKAVGGLQANVIQAAYLASEVALRLMVPGKSSYDVTDAISRISKDFDVTPMQGQVSHQILRNVLEGPNQIIQNPSDAQKKDCPAFDFEVGQVYTVDISISSGTGIPKSTAIRTTVFKRNPDATYQLKMKTSRALFSNIQKECGTMAFNISQIGDEKIARMGIVECEKHMLVTPFHVLSEDAQVARFIRTVLLMPNGPLVVSTFPFEQEMIKSEKSLVDAELVEICARPLRAKKAKK